MSCSNFNLQPFIRVVSRQTLLNGLHMFLHSLPCTSNVVERQWHDSQGVVPVCMTILVLVPKRVGYCMLTVAELQLLPETL